MASVDQLSLVLDEPSQSGLPTRIAPMTASTVLAPFDDEDCFFEPWWPGARAFAFVDGGSLRLSTEHLADPLATFPELRVISSQLTADGVVLDGTLLVLDEEGRPDADLLRTRLADQRATGGEAAFVASDLLFESGRSLADTPFAERHARLASTLRDGRLCVANRGVRGEGVMLAEAVASMGIGAISARRLTGRYVAGDAGDAWVRAPVVGLPAPETRPLLVLLSRLPLD